MKRHLHLLLISLFIFTTLFSSLHELMPNHNSSDCQVCTFSSHDNGLAPEVSQLSTLIKPIFSTPNLLYSVITSSPISCENPRAPPYSFS